MYIKRRVMSCYLLAESCVRGSRCPARPEERRTPRSSSGAFLHFQRCKEHSSGPKLWNYRTINQPSLINYIPTISQLYLHKFMLKNSIVPRWKKSTKAHPFSWSPWKVSSRRKKAIAAAIGLWTSISLLFMTGWWFFATPLKNMSQLGWLETQDMGK